MLIVDMPIEADLVDRRVLLNNLEIWQDSMRGAESLAFLHQVKMLLASAPHIKAQELLRCKDCRWGKETCGNIECFADINVPTEYHGYDWFCPIGERKGGEVMRDE